MAYLTSQRQTEIDNSIQNLILQTGMSSPDDDIVDIAEETGLSVFEQDFGEKYKHVNALLVYSDEKNSGKPTVYLNSNLHETRKRFTLAHELGHFLLHKQADVKFRINGFDYSGNSQYVLEETEANYFAASLLVPEEKLTKLMKFVKKTSVLADYFGVSTEVIDNRLKWLQKNKKA